MDYTLKRSRRKTISIRVGESGVEVRAPLQVSQREIDSFVDQKTAWIERSRTKMAEIVSSRAAFKLDYGVSIQLLGDSCPILAREGDRIGFEKKCFFLPSDLTSAEIKEYCIEIYRGIAQEFLKDRTRALAELIGKTPRRIRITAARTRWGSCSSEGYINYSWKLMMAPLKVIDYVILHELTHLKFLNHSSAFWEALAVVLPDYRERQKELKVLQQRLVREDW